MIETTNTTNTTNTIVPNYQWILGVDVGQRSVGLAAVEVDENDFPKRILSAVSMIHDGGVGDEKTQQSRLAQAGVARRLHRLRRRRRSRLNKVDRLIKGLGLPLPPLSGEHPYAAWEARRRLVEEKIVDKEELNVLLGKAISHISRHRGWRNPWLSLSALQELEAPSAGLCDSITKAQQEYGITLEPGTLGQLGALLSKKPIFRMNPSDKANSKDPLLTTRTRQEDLIWELQLIWEKQNLNSDDLERIIEAVFSQIAPSVPKERIGTDPFDKGQVRAPKASLEFQEFRIRDKVANLRIIEGEEEVPLSQEQRTAVVNALLELREDRITWAEVALDILNLETEANLIVPEEQRISGRAPMDETTAVFERYLNEKKNLLDKTRRWWEQASREERSALIGVLVDSEDTDEMGITTKLPGDELTLLAELHLPAGRAAYGRRTLQQLNEKMSAEPLDLHEARKVCFGVSDDWHPPLPRLDEVTGNPTVDRNLAVVRKFLASAELRWGPPKRVVIEIVREAEKSPAQLMKDERMRDKRRKANDLDRRELIESGILQPTRADLSRKRLLSLYGSRCLYCGESITWEESELDHIVPRKNGGSNRFENLAAVCTNCNRRKSGRPFGLYAKQENINLNDILSRVDSLSYTKGGMWESRQELNSYKHAVKARLRRRSEDPEEILPIEPTSYAATALRDRLKCYLEALPSKPELRVFSGGVTAEARWVLDINIAELLGRDGNNKRIDRRHHAVDAIILTTLRQGVAQQLIKRRNLRTQQEFLLGKPSVDLSSWDKEVARQELFQDWLSRGRKLSDLLVEAVEKDSIPVMQPLRLTPRGQLHKETGEKLHSRKVGAAWSEVDIRKVVDHKIYQALTDLAGDVGELEEDEDRVLHVDGRDLIASEDVSIFPRDCAMMKVAVGAVEMGDIHHARVYAWRSRNGKISYGWLRVWLADLAACDLLKPGVDVFSVELPEWSQSWRHADPELRNAYKRETTTYLGWLVKGDELEFLSIEAIPGKGPIRKFLSHYPERHWVIASFEGPKQITLKPRYLSMEDVNTEKDVNTDDLGNGYQNILKKGWRPSVTTVFSSGEVVVIRRTSLGFPRWNSSHLPVCWNPSRQVKELLI